jgi:hypothetical protein
MNRRWFQVGGLALVVVGLAGCWRSTYPWNQKLSVTVSTPSGEKTAASVHSCFGKVGSVPMTGFSSGAGCKGEAVILEVKPNKYLFVLMEDKTAYLAHFAFPRLSANDDPDDFYAALVATRDVGDVPPKRYPLMVTFDDINNPKTAKQVDPANLAGTFGDGYALMGMTLEITDEAMTSGQVEKVVSWDRSLKGSIGKDMSLPLDHVLNRINDYSFRWGTDQ